MLLLAGLIAVVQLAVYLLVSRANERNAIEHIDQNLRIGAKIFRQNLAERIDYLAASAKLLSDNQKLATENIGPFRYLIRVATGGDMEQASGYSYLDRNLHVLVVVPLYAPYPSVAGWLGVAYPIDRVIANKIKNTTRLDLTFLSNPEEPNPRVLSTTLEPAMAATVAAHRQSPGNGQSTRTEIVTLSGEPYVTLFESLDLLGETSVRIALQRSLADELAPARELENVVLSISLVALLAATFVAIGIARGVSRPVQQLAQHTKLVAAGDYTQRIELPRADELGQLATAFNQMTAGLAERDRVRNLLGMVVSPEIATQLLHSDLKLGGEEREVTILFCDLRDFTSLSEKLAPTEVLSLLNRYLDRMSTIIERHGGVIDKYIGDAIMALFGAPVAVPDAPTRAVAAARDMAQALVSLNAELRNEGKPELAFGIGINTAQVVAGNMGSHTRLNYTVIGDGVNLASRLEGLTKDPAYATPIIVSAATLDGIRPRPHARELGEVKVKGKLQAVKIFALTPKGETKAPYSV
jgi:adenylate cyclase